MRHRNALVLLPISVLSLGILTGCNKPASKKADIYLYSENSYLSVNAYNPGKFAKLPTYRHSLYGDVPYINLKDALSSALFTNDIQIFHTSNDCFEVAKHEDTVNTLIMSIDTKKDILTLYRYDLLQKVLAPVENNGLHHDWCNPSPDDNRYLVHTSNLSTKVGTAQPQVYKLGDYSFDLMDKDQNCYIPFQVFSSILTRNILFDFAYNGIDYYVSTIFDFLSAPFHYMSYYSSDYSFLYWAHKMERTAQLADESYRFAYNLGFGSGYEVFSLKGNGTGYFGNLAYLNDDFWMPENAKYYLTWLQNEESIFITVYNNYDHFTPLGTFKVAKTKGFYDTKKRSKEISKFNYNLIRFQFENIYGLPDVLTKKYGTNNIEQICKKTNLKKGLLSQDSLTYDDAFARFLMQVIDDAHTTFNNRSIYSGFQTNGANVLTAQYNGPRRKGIMTRLVANMEKRKQGYIADIEGFDPNAQYSTGVYMYDKTAFISYDAFVHDDTGIFRDQTYEDNATAAFSLVSSPRGFDLSMKAIKENSNIKNIVIDLRANGGGNVITAPYLAAHFTKDPIFMLYDRNEQVEYDYHYLVDLDHDGDYGDDDDYYADDYNIYVITSDASYSCSGVLSTMAKRAGIKTIGQKTAGGACIPLRYADASGSIFTTSCPLQISYYNEFGIRIHDDDGVPPDYEITEQNLYNVKYISDFLNSLL